MWKQRIAYADGTVALSSRPFLYRIHFLPTHLVKGDGQKLMRCTTFVLLMFVLQESPPKLLSTSDFKGLLRHREWFVEQITCIPPDKTTHWNRFLSQTAKKFQILNLRGGLSEDRSPHHQETYSDMTSETTDSEIDKSEGVAVHLDGDELRDAETIYPHVPGLKGFGVKVHVPHIMNDSAQRSLTEELTTKVAERASEMSTKEMIDFIRLPHNQELISELVDHGEIPAEVHDLLDVRWDENPLVKRANSVYSAETAQKIFTGEYSGKERKRLENLVRQSRSKMNSMNLSLQVPGIVETMAEAVGKRISFCITEPEHNRFKLSNTVTMISPCLLCFMQMSPWQRVIECL
jgi:hypothetical protein